jgi:hypothetical protein
MNEGRYNFRVDLINNSFLDIEVDYESYATKEVYGQIEVKSRVRESRMLTAGFRVELNDPLLTERLERLIKEPYVFPKLIENLKAYKEGHELIEEESDLINYAIKAIRRLDKRR